MAFCFGHAFLQGFDLQDEFFDEQFEAGLAASTSESLACSAYGVDSRTRSSHMNRSFGIEWMRSRGCPFGERGVECLLADQSA